MSGSAAAARAPPVVVPRPLIPIVLVVVPVPTGSVIRPVPVAPAPLLRSVPCRPLPRRTRLVTRHRSWPFRALPRSVVVRFLPIFIFMRFLIIPTPRRLVPFIIIVFLSWSGFVVVVVMSRFYRISFVGFMWFFFLMFLFLWFFLWIAGAGAPAFSFLCFSFDFDLSFAFRRLLAGTGRWICFWITRCGLCAFFLISFIVTFRRSGCAFSFTRFLWLLLVYNVQFPDSVYFIIWLDIVPFVLWKPTFWYLLWSITIYWRRCCWWPWTRKILWLPYFSDNA